MRVPQDLSIVGFDNIPQAAFTCPSLTTIRQLKLDMGRRGAELLLGLIEKKIEPISPPPLEVILVVRESTGPVRAARMGASTHNGRDRQREMQPEQASSRTEG
jgi:LacI family transcriptional regulator